MNFMTQLSGNLREARIALGMTQADVARRLCATQASISQYETARRMPSLETTAMLAWLYGVTLNDLVPVRPVEENVDDNQMKGEW